MSERSDEELAAVLYTALLEVPEPCFVSEICDKVPGLRKRQGRIGTLLETMCENDMVVKVGNKYILKEKCTPQIRNDSTHLTVDGPAHGVIYSNGQRNAVHVESRPPPCAVGTDKHPEAIPQASRAVVPVQHSLVRRSSSSDSVCDPATVQINTEILQKIIGVLQQSQGPIKAKDIAQRTGIGQARKDVNRYLYFLKEQSILLDNGSKEWTLCRAVDGEDLQVYAAQLAKSSSAKPKGRQSTAVANNECPCPNAGPGCVHVSSFQQNIHHHHYNVQVGEHNQMISALPPGGTHPEEGDH